MKTFELKHFTDKADWLIWRHNGITAEDAAIIMGENPWEKREDLLIRKGTLNPVEKPMTEAMEKGRIERPKALEIYKASVHLPNLAPANIANVARPWQICHVDGLDFSTWHLAEIRCGEAAYEKAKGKSMPPKPYWSECQHILATTGLRVLNLYFHTTAAGQTPITMKVWRSEKYIEKLLEAETQFLNEMFALRQDAVVRIAAAEAFQEERSLALSVLDAVTKKGPKIDPSLYRKFVPEYMDRKGNLTTLGQQLLLPETVLTA